jgi:hypothetical protein
VARAIVGDVNQSAASIHDLVLAKEPGLAQLLKYDTYLRESLVDHLSTAALTVDQMLSGNPPSDVGFRQGAYDLEVADGKAAKSSSKRASADSVNVDLVRTAPWNGTEIQITKRVTLKGKGSFEVEYTVENVGDAAAEGFFATEMNYSLLAGEAHDRYFFHEKKDNAGKLATAADFGTLSFIGLKDHWLNVALTIRTGAGARQPGQDGLSIRRRVRSGLPEFQRCATMADSAGGGQEVQGETAAGDRTCPRVTFKNHHGSCWSKATTWSLRPKRRC